MVPGCSRLFTVVHGCPRWFTSVHGCSRLFTVVHGCSRVFTVVHGSSLDIHRLFPDVHGCSRLFTGCSRLFTGVHGCSRVVHWIFTGCSRLFTDCSRYVHGCSRVFTVVHGFQSLDIHRLFPDITDGSWMSIYVYVITQQVCHTCEVHTHARGQPTQWFLYITGQALFVIRTPMLTLWACIAQVYACRITY